MRFVSYAQEYEDICLLSVLQKYVKKGNYVDIGANDPCIISVTKLFYDLGWRGMNIEPLDDMYTLLQMERPEDENWNIGISDKEGELELCMNGALSSFRYIDENAKTSKKQVKRFQDIWEKSAFRKKDIHFCKIDVEGFEKQVLMSIDFDKFHPWIFVIESFSPGEYIPCYSEWEDILFRSGYLFAYAQGANRYYVENDKEYLCCFQEAYRNFIKQNPIYQFAAQNHPYVQNKINLMGVNRLVLFGAGNYLDNFIFFLEMNTA